MPAHFAASGRIGNLVKKVYSRIEAILAVMNNLWTDGTYSQLAHPKICLSSSRSTLYCMWFGSDHFNNTMVLYLSIYRLARAFLQ
jgi:hypothetical protein